MKSKSPQATTLTRQFAQLEHRHGKQLSQQGVEFSHKKMEVRKHPTGGFRGRKGGRGS